MILVIVILVAIVIVSVIVLGMFLSENEGIIGDEIIQDYLDKLGEGYTTYIGEYSQRIDPKYSAPVTKSIERSPWIINLVFPYYIGYVGVIPAWSKSKPRIDAMFAQGVKSNWKRKKLGLE